MRWRQAFLDEVSESLHQLGMRACPVCGSAASLSMSPFPVVLADASFHAEADDLAPDGEPDGDMTFAVRIECATCGHMLLFNALTYRDDEKIIEWEPADPDLWS